jgi:oligosaccharide repeat unit polymerase
MKTTKGLYLANPASIYMLVWLPTLLLFLMGLTSNIQKVKLETLMLVLGNILSFYLIVTLFAGGKRIARLKLNAEDVDVTVLRSFAKKLLVAWFFGTLVDIYFSGGVPLMWALAGDVSRNYTDFGIPSFHGIINACYLLGLTCLFFYRLLTKSRKALLMILILLTWPVFMLGRGILLSALMQILALYLLLNRVSIQKIGFLVFVGLLLVYLFGLTGDMRGYVNPFSYLITPESAWFFDNLPSGFLWVYIYVTTGINNLNANIDILNPSYMPWYSVSNLVPSAIRSIFSDDKRNDLLIFVNESLNTSSFYAGYISDFGAFGAFLIVALIQSIWAWFFISAIKRKNVSEILAYSIVLQCVIFSVFYDLFLLLPYLFQILLTRLYGKKIKWSKA